MKGRRMEESLLSGLLLTVLHSIQEFHCDFQLGTRNELIRMFRENHAEANLYKATRCKWLHRILTTRLSSLLSLLSFFHYCHFESLTLKSIQFSLLNFGIILIMIIIGITIFKFLIRKRSWEIQLDFCKEKKTNR